MLFRILAFGLSARHEVPHPTRAYPLAAAVKDS